MTVNKTCKPFICLSADYVILNLVKFARLWSLSTKWTVTSLKRINVYLPQQ